MLMVRGAKDLLFKESLPGESFEADVVNKYGRTLYEIFFEPYTRKFLFYSPAELHRDWARAGVNRAVIDKRAQADSLWSLLKTTMMPKPVETMFLYPPNGVGRFSDKLADHIRQAGGRDHPRARRDRRGDVRTPYRGRHHGGERIADRQPRMDGAADDAQRHARVDRH